MTHPHHGATHAYDYGEIERLKKVGWVEGKEPTAAEINAQKKGVRAAALKAELATLDEAPPVEAPKPKRGRKPKAA